MRWPLSDAARVEQGGAVGASTTLTTVTASATPHTKGSWVELIASTGPAASGLVLRLATGPATTTVDTSTLLDIGVGAAASEVVTVPDVLLGGYLNNRSAWDLPIAIPPGSRVSARIQSAVISQSISVQAHLYGGGMIRPEGYGRATNYGANTATSSGVQPTAPGATHTKGAWTEIVASTTNPMRAMLLCIAAPPTATASNTSGLLDIGVGGAGSEVAVVSDVFYVTSTSEDITYIPLTLPMNIPAGSRISARYQATSTAAGGRPAVAVIGFD